ncbi:hypothetical protein TrRE_jg4104, partial [Triparma retinervis]
GVLTVSSDSRTCYFPNSDLSDICKFTHDLITTVPSPPPFPPPLPPPAARLTAEVSSSICGGSTSTVLTVSSSPPSHECYQTALIAGLVGSAKATLGARSHLTSRLGLRSRVLISYYSISTTRSEGVTDLLRSTFVDKSLIVRDRGDGRGAGVKGLVEIEIGPNDDVGDVLNSVSVASDPTVVTVFNVEVGWVRGAAVGGVGGCEGGREGERDELEGKVGRASVVKLMDLDNMGTAGRGYNKRFMESLGRGDGGSITDSRVGMVVSDLIRGRHGGWVVGVVEPGLGEAAKTLKVLKGENLELEQEVGVLQKTVAELQFERDELKTRLKGVEGDNLGRKDRAKLRRALADVRDYEIYKGVMEQALGKLKKELEGTGRERDALRGRAERLEGMGRRLKKECFEIKKTNVRMEGELEMLLAEKLEAQEEARRYKEMYEEMEGRMKAAAKEVGRLRVENKGLGEEASKAKRRLSRVIVDNYKTEGSPGKGSPGKAAAGVNPKRGVSAKEWREEKEGKKGQVGKRQDTNESLNRAQGNLNAARRIMFT